ncbi:MAG: hypothetical protein ACYC8V_12540 [Caulobacteraceae bacterium]
MAWPTPKPITPARSALRSLAWLGGLVASLAAVVVGAVMAVFVAATMVVTALLASAVLAFLGAALRARRSVRPRDPSIIEARNVGGHHWVAYGWDGGS